MGYIYWMLHKQRSGGGGTKKNRRKVARNRNKERTEEKRKKKQDKKEGDGMVEIRDLEIGEVWEERGRSALRLQRKREYRA
jgi:hypothetical protein